MERGRERAVHLSVRLATVTFLIALAAGSILTFGARSALYLAPLAVLLWACAFREGRVSRQSFRIAFCLAAAVAGGWLFRGTLQAVRGDEWSVMYFVPGVLATLCAVAMLWFRVWTGLAVLEALAVCSFFRSMWVGTPLDASGSVSLVGFFLPLLAASLLLTRTVWGSTPLLGRRVHVSPRGLLCDVLGVKKGVPFCIGGPAVVIALFLLLLNVLPYRNQVWPSAEGFSITSGCRELDAVEVDVWMQQRKTDARVDIIILEYARTAGLMWGFRGAEALWGCGNVVLKFPAVTRPAFFSNPGLVQKQSEKGVEAYNQLGDLVGSATVGLCSTVVVLYSDRPWPQWRYHMEGGAIPYPWWENVAGGISLYWDAAFDRAAFADYAFRLDLTGDWLLADTAQGDRRLTARVHVPHALMIVASWPAPSGYDIQQDNKGGSFDTYTFEVGPSDNAFFVRFRDERAASDQTMLTIVLATLLGLGLGLVVDSYVRKRE